MGDMDQLSPLVRLFSLLRLLKAIIWGFVLFVVLFFTFATIPSPTVPTSKIALDLQHGVPVIRAYRYWTFFPTFPLEVRRHFEELIAIQWSFSSGTNTLSINRQYEFLLEPGVEGQSGGYVASINATVVTNVNDGVMLPWFNFADAVLLNDGITPKVANLPLQLIRRPTHEKTAIYDIVGACASVTENALLRPLLTITYESNPSSARVPTFAFPSELYSTSPSTTFPIRRAVLSVLAPVALVSVRVVEAGAVVVKLIFYAAIFGGLCIVLLGLLRNWRSERMEIVRQGQREGGGTETKPEVNDADIKMAISNSAEDLV